MAPHNHLLPTLPWLHELQCRNASQNSSKMNNIFLKCGWLHSFAVQRRMWWGFQFSLYRIDSYAACYNLDIKKTKQENSILMLLSNFYGKFTARILIIVYKMQLYPTKQANNIKSRANQRAHHKGSFLLLVFIKLANVNSVNPVSVSTFRSVHVIDNYCTKVLREHAPTSTNHISPKNSPRCQHAKSPIAQNTFRSIPDLISCAGVARRWGLPSHAQNAVRWLA